MNRRVFLFLFALVACFAGRSVLLAADGAAEAKARMRDRVGAIDRLKLAEAIGENNRGYLEVRKPEGDAAAVADAENRDRATVFGETASRTGSTTEAVGKAFAKQVAAASAPGVWIQREDGTWVKK